MGNLMESSGQTRGSIDCGIKADAISWMFLDVGGVLLTDGWDRHARKQVATNFCFDLDELEERHHLIFETYEEGKITLEDYLSRVVFYKERSFSRAQFRRFMFAQSRPYREMIAMITRLKVRYTLKIAVVSNEGRELNEYRIRKFKLDKLVDFYISSCFVHVRKPDEEIFQLALDIAHATAQQVIFIDNTPMFVEIAAGLGMRTILHTDYKSTCMKLQAIGLQSDEGVRSETA